MDGIVYFGQDAQDSMIWPTNCQRCISDKTSLKEGMTPFPAVQLIKQLTIRLEIEHYQRANQQVDFPWPDCRPSPLPENSMTKSYNYS